MEHNSEENVSKYFQKQYERFVKQMKNKPDLNDAFVELKEEPPEEPETMYTRRKTNPRR